MENNCVGLEMNYDQIIEQTLVQLQLWKQLLVIIATFKRLTDVDGLLISNGGNISTEELT